MRLLRTGTLLLLAVALPALGQSRVATPEIRPPGGQISGSSVGVTISCSTSGATIFYTTNSSEPTPEATRYTGSTITVDRGMTLKAKAYKFGMADSQVATATFVKGLPPGATPGSGAPLSGKVADPVVTPDSKEFTGKLEVRATCPTSGAEIRYSGDGADPTPGHPLLREKDTIDATRTMKFRAFKAGMMPSNVVTRRYILGKTEQVAEPVVNPKSQGFAVSLTFDGSCPTSGAEVRYTADGSVPTPGSPLFRGKDTTTETKTFKFRAFKAGMNPSNVVERTYTKSAVPPTPAKGVVSPEEKAKTAEECNRIQTLQKEIDRIKADRAERRKRLGLDPDPDCRTK